MRLATLFSGGKDSTYATYLASKEGDIAYLVTVDPIRRDSWMFHTVNIHLCPLLSEALDIELIMVESSGDKEAELEDLKTALTELEIDGLVSGAIASNYQKKRVEAICNELELTHISPLWERSPSQLLHEILDVGMEIVVTAVAAMGLEKKWLGRVLDQNAVKELYELSLRYGFNICGEGGEMETLVVNAPWFKKRLEITNSRTEWDGLRGFYLVEEAKLTQNIQAT
jgi:ABC transporter with metal-binding/Fe-S-binding domain ATP-binding protein